MNKKIKGIYLEIYTSKYKTIWNELIKESCNALFFHNRNYLDYNKKLYNEKSLLIFKNDTLVAVFLANVVANTVYSFSGLTFGGLLLKQGERSFEIAKYLDLIINFYYKEGFKKIIYKPVPHIFHKYPCEEDLFFLMKYNTKILKRDLSSYIPLGSNQKVIKYNNLRKRQIKKAKLNNILITDSIPIDIFYSLLEKTLQKHKAKPTHKLNDLIFLCEKFPEDIKFKAAKLNDRFLSAVMIFKFMNIFHTQYIVTSNDGGEFGALDLIIDDLLTNSQIEGLSLGRSNKPENALELNESLIWQKESFGARGIILETYEINLY